MKNCKYKSVRDMKGLFCISMGVLMLAFTNPIVALAAENVQEQNIEEKADTENVEIQDVQVQTTEVQDAGVQSTEAQTTEVQSTEAQELENDNTVVVAFYYIDGAYVVY